MLEDGIVEEWKFGEGGGNEIVELGNGISPPFGRRNDNFIGRKDRNDRGERNMEDGLWNIGDGIWEMS